MAVILQMKGQRPQEATCQGSRVWLMAEKDQNLGLHWGACAFPFTPVTAASFLAKGETASVD